MNNTSDISLIYLRQTPAAKIDFERQLQRLRQGFEQQTTPGKVVTLPHYFIHISSAYKV